MTPLVTFDFSTFTATDVAQIAAAVGTAAIAVITLFYVLATRAMVREMREGRQSQLRPYVVVDFDYAHINLCEMIVKNIGSGAAMDLMITFDPDDQYQETGVKLSELPIFSNMRFMVPGREFRFYYKNLVGETPPLDQQVITAKLQYKDAFGNRYQEEISLNPYVRRQLYFLGEKTLSDLVKEVEKVPKGLRDLEKAIGSLQQSATNEWLASVPPFHSANEETVRAKLLEVKILWQEIYSKDEYRHPTRFQARFHRMAFEIVVLVSLAQMAQDKPSQELVAGAARAAQELYDLGSFRFFLDGGASTEKFNERGSALMSRIDDMLS